MKNKSPYKDTLFRWLVGTGIIGLSIFIGIVLSWTSKNDPITQYAEQCKEVNIKLTKQRDHAIGVVSRLDIEKRQTAILLMEKEEFITALSDDCFTKIEVLTNEIAQKDVDFSEILAFRTLASRNDKTLLRTNLHKCYEEKDKLARKIAGNQETQDSGTAD